MFYDFVDKTAQLEKEEMDRMTADFAGLVEEAFKEADQDRNGWLDLEECKPMCESLIKSFGESLDEKQKNTLLEKMFNWLDTDNSGTISWGEVTDWLYAMCDEHGVPKTECDGYAAEGKQAFDMADTS